MKLVTVAEMRAIEQEADSGGLTYAKMMENAGQGLAKAIQGTAYGQVEEPEILALVGPGNNGGDALVALSVLAANGWETRACIVARDPASDPLVTRFKEAGGDVFQAGSDVGYSQLKAFVESADVLLDGLLGTGLRLPLKDESRLILETARSVIDKMEWPPLVVAVDCPSGVDCDSGEAAEACLPADRTFTMAAVKQGLLKFPACRLTGELDMVGIGPIDERRSWQALRHEVADAAIVRAILPARPLDAHKGTFGTALVAAGSVNFTGAAYLAGEAAYRVGAGLVTLAVPEPLHAALAGQFPEATWILLPHQTGVIAREAAEVLLAYLGKATALLVGPGLGMEETTGEFLEGILARRHQSKKASGRMGFVQTGGADKDTTSGELPPLVLDADALKHLAKIPNWHRQVPAMAVLTPHPGEMAVLSGLKIEVIQKERRKVASHYAEEWGHVVVLKGAFTVIAAPDGRTTTVPVATPALARAGSGDVLAGLIAGLRAQGVEAYDAARAGAWIHARAGLSAMDAMGSAASVLAGDILDSVVDVIAEVQ